MGADGAQPGRAGGLPAPTHDPNEVTVQVDGLGRHLAGESGGVVDVTQGQQGIPDTQDLADRPVFVDETGRRSRRYRRIGGAVGLLCAGYAVVIVATLASGNSSAPWLPVPGPKDEQPAGKVDTPDVSAEPVVSPTSPSSSGAAPKPGAPRSGGGSTAEPAGEPGRAASSRKGNSGDRPGGSAEPDPTRGGGKPGSRPAGGGERPGTGSGDGPTRPAPALDPDVDPEPTDESTPTVGPPTQTPENTGGGEAGGGGTADGGEGGGAGAGSGSGAGPEAGGETPVGTDTGSPSAPATTSAPAVDVPTASSDGVPEVGRV
ncbi:translation initiation factor IF-2 [Streptomyces lasiicapitis]|uniref:translation initiation factor IF-2 n=1 Tax=Streptomyces lasiicapitis TaxID=1923961 RepID=UPI0036608E0B